MCMQGYLSCNRFGSLLGIAHAGVTAEGDNRVLFTKVAKELTASLHTAGVQARLAAGRAPPAVDVAALGDAGALLRLLEAREGRRLGALVGAMRGLRPGPALFDAWMKHQSDAIQAAAQAFAEREVLAASLRAVGTLRPEAAAALAPVVLAYALGVLDADAAWLMTEGLLPVDVARALPDALRALCTRLGPRLPFYVGAFGIPEHLLSAPIAHDWALYNQSDNKGEVLGERF